MKKMSMIVSLFILLFIPVTTQAQTPPDKADLYQPVSVRESLYQTLAAQAEAEGSVRVIVGLNTPFATAGQLSRSQIAHQQQRIRHAQTALRDSLSSTATVIQQYEHIPFMALNVDAETLAQLQANPAVSSLEEDSLYRPLLNKSVNQIGASNAWQVGYTGEGWTIAVLDTGVDSTHPFLQEKVVSEACYSNAKEAFFAFSLCPNRGVSQIGPGSGRHCNIGGCSHGTHVAGIAAGQNADFAGVARDAKIIAIQVFTEIRLPSLCSRYGIFPCILSHKSNQIAALDRVYQLRNEFKIAAVNMSLGGEQYFDVGSCNANNLAIKAIVDQLRSVGIPTIAASGNNGYKFSMTAPACISSVISVGAVDDFDRVPRFSNSAAFLDLLAPGNDIISSIPGNRYDSFNGTSMAAPHVSGAWAIHKQVNPAASIDDILAYLKRTGKVVLDDGSNVRTPRIQIDSGLSRPAVSLAVSADKSSPQAGEIINYRYHVKNNGNIKLAVTVQDAALGRVSLNKNSLSPGEEATGQASYTVRPSDIQKLPDPIINQATVTGVPTFGERVTDQFKTVVYPVYSPETLTLQPSNTLTYTLTTADQILSITVPPDALPTSMTQLTYLRTRQANGLPAFFGGYAFTLTPNSPAPQPISPSLRLTVDYTNLQLPSVINESDLTIYSYDNSSPQWLRSTVVTSDTVANTIRFTQAQFRAVALAGKPATGILYLPIIGQ